MRNLKILCNFAVLMGKAAMAHADTCTRLVRSDAIIEQRGHFQQSTFSVTDKLKYSHGRGLGSFADSCWVADDLW